MLSSHYSEEHKRHFVFDKWTFVSASARNIIMRGRRCCRHCHAICEVIRPGQERRMKWMMNQIFISSVGRAEVSWGLTGSPGCCGSGWTLECVSGITNTRASKRVRGSWRAEMIIMSRVFTARVRGPGIVRGDTGHSLLKLMWWLLRPGSFSADTSTPGDFDFEFYQNKLTHGLCSWNVS